MAKIAQFIAKFAQEIKELQTNQTLLPLAAKARDLLYKRVKAGYGVSSTTSSSPTRVALKPLSKSYASMRGGTVSFKTRDGKQVTFKIPQPSLGPYASPRRSNLTFSGFLLENLKYKVNGNKIVLYFPNQKHRLASFTLTKLVELVEEQRPFFNLTFDEQRVLLAELEREIRKITRRF